MYCRIANTTTTEKAKFVADAINKNGGQALAVPGDMLDDRYIDSLVKQAADFGGGKIHIIVNNAGYTWDGVIHKVRKHINSIQIRSFNIAARSDQKPITHLNIDPDTQHWLLTTLTPDN
jgi:NAD(P)-dependent dehydrogenase (short-subunit alcohol dehydrogenase family)